jgi:hypothetical protein
MKGDPADVPERLAEAADLLTESLGSGAVGAAPKPVVARWLREVMPGHWHQTQSVARWAAENARAGNWPLATRTAIRDSLLDAAEFAALVGQVVRSLGEMPQSLEPSDPSAVLVRVGEREKGLSTLRAWIEDFSTRTLQIIDPHFDPDGLLILAAVAPKIEFRIFTRNRLNNGEPLRSAADVLEESVDLWRNVRRDDPPSVELTVLGNAEGKCPFHDRFILADEGGIQLGSSLNGLGSRDSELVRIGRDRVGQERANLAKWILAGVPLLDGSLVEISIAKTP